MIIRPARVGDVPVLEDIAERAYGGYVERIGRRPGQMDDDYGLLLRSGQVDVFVGEDPCGTVCGLIVLEVAPDHVLIANVAVDPDFQGAGIGRALLAHAESFAADRGLGGVRLFTNVAMIENQRLYRRLGYREDGREVKSEFARVYFSKRIDAPPGHRELA